MSCINLTDIDHSLDCNKGASGGIVPRVIFGYHEDVDTWPDEPKPDMTVPVEMEKMGALIGDVIMKPGKRAFFFDFTEDVGNFTIAPQGEKYAISFLSTLNITKYGISKKLLGFQNAAANRKLFFIVEDELGNRYLMGDMRRGAYFTGGDGNQTNSTFTEFNQSVMQFTYNSRRVFMYCGETDELLQIATPTPTP